VIDHGQNDYFWSVGENKVFVNDGLARRQDDDRGINVDIDLGSLPKVGKEQRDKHLKAISNLLDNTDYMLLSLNSSLGFAYVAVGKIDGFIWEFNHPWDVCAGSFLIQQSGGIITNLDGSEWRLDSIGCIAAKDESIHRTLLNAYMQ
jgi:myo-inositol-1(or 4)-monophosphatase